MDAIKTLAQFQLWRTGADERTLDEIGLTPANISAAINGVLDELNQLKQHNAELVEFACEVQKFTYRTMHTDFKWLSKTSESLYKKSLELQKIKDQTND